MWLSVVFLAVYFFNLRRDMITQMCNTLNKDI